VNGRRQRTHVHRYGSLMMCRRLDWTLEYTL